MPFWLLLGNHTMSYHWASLEVLSLFNKKINEWSQMFQSHSYIDGNIHITATVIKSTSISLINTPDCVKSLLVKSVCMQLHNVKRWIQRSNQIMYIVFKGKKKKEKNSYLNIWSKMSPINSLKAMEKSNNARNRKWFSFRLSVCDLRILFFNISHR